MLEELEKLIEYVLPKYQKTNESWKQDVRYQEINLKKKQIRDVFENKPIWENILNYRNFINDENMSFILELQQFNVPNFSKVEARIKLQNSTEDKLIRYFQGEQQGKVSIIKSMDDLLGMRIIYNTEIQHEEVEQFIKNKYPKFRCIKAVRGNDNDWQKYIATHIYFKDGNNAFPWELQIWEQKREVTNKESHKRYKQEYTKWETKNKEGEEV